MGFYSIALKWNPFWVVPLMIMGVQIQLDGLCLTEQDYIDYETSAVNSMDMASHFHPSKLQFIHSCGYSMTLLMRISLVL